ncbi:hypothetical protein GIB67_043029 [Kingdonia uniflora]|uniref:RRM domain-containing protein n=1 Tax=Kingdonia uniflora TaxID=39325 RepID=A0A7J7NT57_9MAGN|nr:hypothetical protein GIB67_043029 [Kingdonia uniflora]
MWMNFTDSRNDLNESEDQQIARFANGLKWNIQKELATHQHFSLHAAINNAMKVEHFMEQPRPYIRPSYAKSPSNPSPNAISATPTYTPLISSNTPHPELPNTSSNNPPNKPPVFNPNLSPPNFYPPRPNTSNVPTNAYKPKTNPYAQSQLDKCLKYGKPGHNFANFLSRVALIEETSPKSLEDDIDNFVDDEPTYGDDEDFVADFSKPEELFAVVVKPVSFEVSIVILPQVDYACTPEEVQQHFQACGTVNRVTILTDKFGQPKGFAYVEFLETEAVQDAIQLNESELHGRQLKVSAKRTNVPGMKQFRPRRFNSYMGYQSRRAYMPPMPPYMYSPYGYGKVPRFRRAVHFRPYY